MRLNRRRTLECRYSSVFPRKLSEFRDDRLLDVRRHSIHISIFSELVFNRRHDRAVKPTRLNRFKITKISRKIQSKTVIGDPLANGDTDARDLQITNPNARLKLTRLKQKAFRTRFS